MSISRMRFVLPACLAISLGVIYSACHTPSAAEETFNTQCAICHMDNGQSRAPSMTYLYNMPPRSIIASLENGKMQAQGALLSAEEKIAVAEFITGNAYTPPSAAPNLCEEAPGDMRPVSYLGYGGNLAGTGMVPDSIAQLAAAQVPQLSLKWAFGFEGGSLTRAKPAVLGDYIMFGSQFGEVYCLQRETGCVKWVYLADAAIRGGVAISQEAEQGLRAYVADFNGNVYALNPMDGSLIWKIASRNDPNNGVTGTPVYYDGLLYIPHTSMEVVIAEQDAYECCKSSGQIVALNAADGSEVWRHRVVEPATEQGTNAVGARRFGPSGAPVWSSPTVDTLRGLLYFGTGENNSQPVTETSDAIQAVDLKTGALRWNFQGLANDAYISACEGGQAANCPDPFGPDLDFGVAPILTTRPDGKDVLVVGQKSGMAFCLEPETGKLLWKKRIGGGSSLGGVHWGLTTDGRYAYFANSDWHDFGRDSAFGANPGLIALDLMDGTQLWKYTADPGNCEGQRGCYASHSAAPTMIPGVVFAGSLDGDFRAHDAATGEAIWSFDTHKAFETVNGVAGHGGAIDGPGPVIAGGMVYVSSGYGLFGQMPGNVLLAFEVE